MSGDWKVTYNNDRYFLVTEFFKVFYPETKDIDKAMTKSLKALTSMIGLFNEIDQNALKLKEECEHESSEDNS